MGSPKGKQLTGIYTRKTKTWIPSPFCLTCIGKDIFISDRAVYNAPLSFSITAFPIFQLATLFSESRIFCFMFDPVLSRMWISARPA